MVAAAIRARVVDSEPDVQSLLAGVDASIHRWQLDRAQGVHLKYTVDRQIAGVALVRNFWNLAMLFVAPAYQRQGIGRALVEAAVLECKPHSVMLKVNSSTFAVGFYLSLGFRQVGPGLDRPGGCVPFEYPIA